MTEIRLLSAPGIIRIVVIHQEQLTDFAVWYHGFPDGWGDLYQGRVETRVSALGGVFVALGKDLSGFLADNAGAKSLNEGDWVFVRVTRSAQGGKGVRLDARDIPELPITEKTPHLIEYGPTPLQSLLERWENTPILIDDPSLIHHIPVEYKANVRIAKEHLNAELLEEIDALETAYVELPQGMRASITPTPALIAIDMDTGAQSNDTQNKLRAQFEANRIAIPLLLRHLKLRNLSGAILVDMAGLPIKKRRIFQSDFEKELQKDPLRPKFLGFTNLGLAEITRPRKRPPLHELFLSDHGRAIHVLGLVQQQFQNLPSHHQYRHITLKLSLALSNALRQDSWAIQDFEQRYSVSLTIESIPAYTTLQWEYHYD